MRSRLYALGQKLPPSVKRTIKKIPGTSQTKDRFAGRPRIPGPAPGEKRAVVYPPTWVHWDVMKQRPQYILESFARAGHPVYFVDPTEATARTADGVHIVPTLNEVPAAGSLIYTHFAPVRTMLDGFEDPVIVYDILDDLSIFDEDEAGLPENRKVRFHHPDIMRSADVVIASAPALVEAHSSERDDIVYVENGVDTRRFSDEAPEPDALVGLVSPVVGYHGMIARWFDFELLAAVADLMPEVTFALIGPVDVRSEADAARLRQLPNVVFVGELPSTEMPGVVQRFDVGLVPFVVDDLTRAVSPLKMYEYLAGGTPVVATPLPVCVSHDLVATASDPAAFADEVRSALAQSADPQLIAERTRAAQEADWDVRLTPLLHRLDQLGAWTVPK
ncbi:MAG: glycosyltransferase [Acidimicrobiia bacterium]